jgi:hypothetical protein
LTTAGPAGEVGFSSLLLGEKVVGEAHGHLAIGMQLLDDVVVVGIVLIAAAGIDDAGDSQTVELAHEMAGGVDLVVEGKLRALGQRRVEDYRVGLGQQQTGGIALGIALDLAARRVGRVLGVTHGAQGRGVEERAVIKMQHEDRRVGRDGIDLGQGRQALLGELVFGEAAHHAHPLRWRGNLRLALQHRHGIGQARHAVPAQFDIVVEAAADDVDMAVDQPRDRAAALEVDDLRVRSLERHDLAGIADGAEPAIGDGDGFWIGLCSVERGETAVDEE